MTLLYKIRQQGLSMIELLIALAISSFLILGITQIYIDNKRSYIFQQNQAGNLDSSRFAVLMLDELLSKAGYRRAPDQSMLDAFPKASALTTHCAEFPAESVVTALKSSDDTGFCMRYQPATTDEDLCDGKTTSLTDEAPFHYPAHNEIIYLAIKFAPAAGSLQGGTVSCLSNKGGNAELLDGIADMQVQFASGTGMEKRLKENSYKNASSWAASDGVVRAIRYSVLTSSRDNQRDSNDSLVFESWISNTASDSSKTRLEARDKRNIYQAAIGSQALRNMMP